MRFYSNFVLPVAIIVLATVASLAGVLVWLTNVQDRMELDREHQSVIYGLNTRVDFLRNLSRDYAIWDDAVRNLVLKLDPEWADENFGVYVYENYGFDFNFVVDQTGEALYAVLDGARAETAEPVALLGRGFAQALRETLERSEPPEAIAGLTESARGLAIFSLSVLRPASEELEVPPGTRRMLVVAKLIDDQAVEEISKAAGGLDLSLGPPGAAEGGSLDLVTHDGRQVAALRWTPDRPGAAFRRQVLPWLALFPVFVTALGTFVVLKARRATLELVGSEKRAQHLAHHDPLTSLPNRRAFTEHLLTLSRRGDEYALLYMDLDGFKEVNDTYGHTAGDVLLRETADRLLGLAKGQGVLARVGGDEFAVIYRPPFDADGMKQRALRIIAAVREPYDVGGGPLTIGVSIGIAVSEGADYEEVVRRADVAMYCAKAQGRNTWCLFDPEIDETRRERKKLADELHRALSAGEISLVYQPIVRGRDGLVSAMEALARWTHPVRGAISPGIFIPVAEESGVIDELGQYVLRNACRAARAWPFKLSVNLSPAQFWNPKLVEDVLRILEECNFPANKLELEITETYLLQRPEAAAEVISRLRQHGIEIALDDFGTGYASIGYLKRFELDLVKLDRSFIERVCDDPKAAEVVQAVVALGRALDLPVLAEGVETADQARILSLVGCSYMQGWHFGRPIPAAEVNARIAEQTLRPAA